MTHEEALNLLNARLAGEITPQQTQALEVWLNEHEDHRILAEAFQTQDVALRKTFEPRRDSAATNAERVVAQLPETVPPNAPIPATRKKWWPALIGPMVAAAVLAAIALLWIRQQAPTPNPERHVVKQLNSGTAGEGLRPKSLPASPKVVTVAVGDTITTKPGEKRRVTLGDGTIVYVNQNSTLKVEESRHLKLTQGEVFLEAVPANADRGRFTVETPDKTVTALGTKFSVKAENKGTGVLVTQGKVQVSGINAELTNGQELAPGSTELAVAPRASHALDWTRELMIAADTPLVPAGKYNGGALVAVDPYGQEAKLSMVKYHIDVHIEDGFARTTIDQTYFNHENFQMEGTFYFPLPPDASLSRLAMYVSSENNESILMEGGMAERDIARQTYEKIRYQRRDPALLEWVDGSLFKMRVFPLEARQQKRIILSYSQKVSTTYGRTTYRFPAGHTLAVVDQWSFQATVKGGATTSATSPSHPEMKLKRIGDDIQLNDSARLVKVDKDIVVELLESQPGIAKNLRWSQADHEGHRYLMLRYRPELPIESRRERRDWVFLFEASGARDPLVARAQVEVLRNLMNHAEHEDTFAMLTVGTRIHSFSSQPVPMTVENITSAIKFLENTHLIGALHLEAALQEAQPLLKAGSNPHLVHVGGGTASLGEQRVDQLLAMIPQGTRYVGVGVGKRVSTAFMKPAAEKTGGLFTQINPDEPIAWRGFELAATLNNPRLLDISVTATGKEPPKFLTFTNSLSHGEELAAVARVPDAMPHSVTVRGMLDGKPFEQTIPVGEIAPNAGYLPRTWAKLEIDRLLAADAIEHRKAITDLSLGMYVMTPFTSLLVLENEAMYKEFKIDRGRKDHWAMYGCPAKIPTVTIPDPNQPVGVLSRTQKPHANIVMQTIMCRTMPRYLTWPNANHQGDQPVMTIGQRMPHAVGDMDKNKDLLNEESGMESDVRLGELFDGKKLITGERLSDFREKLPEFGLTRPIVFASSRVDELNDAAFSTFTRRRKVNLDGRFPREEMNELRVWGGNRLFRNVEALEAEHLQLEKQLKQLTSSSTPMHKLRIWSLEDDEKRLSGRSGTTSERLLRFAGVNMHGGDEFDGVRLEDRERGLDRLINFATPTPFFLENSESQNLLVRSERESVNGSLPFLYSNRIYFDPMAPAEPAAVAKAETLELDYRFGRVANLLTDRARGPQYYSSPRFSGVERVFTDLVAYAPGMSSSRADARAVIAEEAAPRFGSRRGSIDPKAKAILDAARTAEWRSTIFPSEKGTPFTILHDGQGRFAYERKLHFGLIERVVCDGKTMLHLYPELGIGAKRSVTRFHREDLFALLPDLVPPAEDLNHGADIKFVDDRTVAIVPMRLAKPENEGKPRAWFELHLVIGAGRILERRQVLMTENITNKEWIGPKVLLREVYDANGTIKVIAPNLDGKEKDKELATAKRERKSVASPDLKPNVNDLVVLPLPLRSRNQVYAKYDLDPNNHLAAEVNACFEYLEPDAKIEILAADFAANRSSDVLHMWHHHYIQQDDKRRGYFTLLASAGYPMNQLPRLQDRANEAPNDPLLRYLFLFQNERFCNYQQWFGMYPGADLPNDFLSNLLTFRTLKLRWESEYVSSSRWGHRETERKRALDFVRRHADNEWGWCTLAMLSNHPYRGPVHHTEFHREIAATWEHLGKATGLTYYGRYEQARNLYNSGAHLDAREKFRALFDEQLNQGILPPLDSKFKAALEVGNEWPKLMRSIAAEAVKKKYRPNVVLIAWQARQLGDSALADTLLDSALKDVPADEKVSTYLAAIEFLFVHGHYERADALMMSLLEDEKLQKSPLMWRLASSIAQRREHTVRQMEYFEKAMDREFASMPEMFDVQSVRSEYGTLMDHYQWLANSARALKVAPPADLQARIIRAADRWRSLDPEVDPICDRAARILRSIGTDSDAAMAWDYLTTPLAMKPNESSPWLSLANTAKREGDLKLADQCYSAAYASEPTNAQILWDHAQLHQQRGNIAEYHNVLRRITAGDWQDRFSGLKTQAKYVLEGR